MFELTINISRYLFLIYMLYFLWKAVAYIIDERGAKRGGKSAIFKQRIAICCFHVTAYLILAYIPSELMFKTETLLVGGAGLALLVSACFVVSKIYKNSCPLIWNGMFFLLDIGFVMLQRLKPDLAQKQLMWIAVAMAVVMLMPIVLKFIPKLEKFELFYLISGLCVLALPFVFGSVTYGALNWVNIMGVSFQPSEIVKYIYIFYLASVFGKEKKITKRIVPALFSAIFVLILVIQKDLGGALIFFMAFLTIAYIGTGSELMFMCGLTSAAGASVLAYKIFGHVRDRVITWQNPWGDIDNKGYQIIHALFAIGTWGFMGSGLTRGYPLYIPVNESDMIFAAICEEFGAIFGIGLIFVFVMVFYRGINISLRCKTRYMCLLAAGFACMPAFQAFLILGGVIKLIPLTGVTLPFVSYGGSSILVSVLMMGILQWIYSINNKKKE